MLGSCIPELLEHDDEFECLTDYFISIDPEAGDEASKLTSFTSNLKDSFLPKFSDSDNFADRYNSQTLMQSDIRRNA
jgi:hypothetical protein